MNYKSSFIVMTFSVLFLGCSDGQESSGDIPLESLGVSATIWLDANSSEGGVSFGKLSTNGIVNNTNLLGSSDSTISIGGGDKVVVQSGAVRAHTTQIRGSQYGALFPFDSTEPVDVLFYRDQTLATAVNISPSPTIAPLLNADSLVLDADNSTLNVQLDYGLPNGFELPDPVTVLVTREVLECELDGVVNESTVADISDPSLFNTGAIADEFTRTLDAGSLVGEYRASSIAGPQKANLESGFYDSCLVMIRASMYLRSVKPDGSWQFTDLVSIDSTGNAPAFNIELYIHSAPTTIRVERSAILAQ